MYVERSLAINSIVKSEHVVSNFNRIKKKNECIIDIFHVKMLFGVVCPKSQNIRIQVKQLLAFSIYKWVFIYIL